MLNRLVVVLVWLPLSLFFILQNTPGRPTNLLHYPNTNIKLRQYLDITSTRDIICIYKV